MTHSTAIVTHFNAKVLASAIVRASGCIGGFLLGGGFLLKELRVHALVAASLVQPSNLVKLGLGKLFDRHSDIGQLIDALAGVQGVLAHCSPKFGKGQDLPG